MRVRRVAMCVVGGAAAVAPAGCGTTRMTDTSRAASEMLLVSQAVDNAVAKVDCSALAGKPVFLDTQYLDGTVDKGYVISSLRQHLLAHGALLQEKRDKARYVVEARSGGVGTDKSSVLVGTPQMSLPAVVPGMPTSVPEIALIKDTKQKGVAKLAVFAYDRESGRALWESGLVEANSTLTDTWVFGAGPYSRGTIRKHAELAGEEIPRLPLPFAAATGAAPPPPDPGPAPAALSHLWRGPDAPPGVIPVGLLVLAGPAAVAGRPVPPPDRPDRPRLPASAGPMAGSGPASPAPPPTEK